MSKDDEDDQLEEGIEGGGGRELRREDEAEDEEAKSQKVHPPVLGNLEIVLLQIFLVYFDIKFFIADMPHKLHVHF